VIDRIAPEMTARAHDMNRWTGGSAHRQTGELPGIVLSQKSAAGGVLRYDIEDGLTPLAPSFELIPRGEKLRRKGVRGRAPCGSVPRLALCR
jgi:hypothetical protein